MAISGRGLQAGLVHHSDQGIQYVSPAVGHAAREACIRGLEGIMRRLFRLRCRRKLLRDAQETLIRRHGLLPTRADRRLALFDSIEAFFRVSSRFGGEVEA
jgi:transposase InsO family protein